MIDDLFIQYRGFSPSKFAQTYVEDVMRKLHEEAPSSSLIRVSIARASPKTFKGFVRISSHAGTFFAMGSSTSLIELAHQLLERTRRQLAKWKSRRFAPDTGQARGNCWRESHGQQEQAK